MKTCAALVVRVVLVSIFLCPLAMSVPSVPDDLQIVQPDPSLPKELRAFWGKWEGMPGMIQYFLIVEKIDEEKASLCVWRCGHADSAGSWERSEANVVKDRGKYKLRRHGLYGSVEYVLKGQHLIMSSPLGSSQLRWVAP